MNSDFPTFQWSVFKDGQAKEQFVVRGNDKEAFTLDVEWVKSTFLNHSQEQTEINEKPSTTKYVCSTCGASAELKQGISKKTNNPYKLMKCSANFEHNRFI